MYIRTKDGVYKVSHYNDWATHKRKGATLIEGYKTAYIKNENIIAQSENLTELCDEYVLHNDNTTKLWFFEFYDLINEYLNEGKNHKYTIYGAVWTSKGLIYVAKMNEKGELELI